MSEQRFTSWIDCLPSADTRYKRKLLSACFQLVFLGLAYWLINSVTMRSTVICCFASLSLSLNVGRCLVTPNGETHLSSDALFSNPDRLTTVTRPILLPKRKA